MIDSLRLFTALALVTFAVGCTAPVSEEDEAATSEAAVTGGVEQTLEGDWSVGTIVSLVGETPNWVSSPGSVALTLERSPKPAELPADKTTTIAATIELDAPAVIGGHRRIVGSFRCSPSLIIANATFENGAVCYESSSNRDQEGLHWGTRLEIDESGTISKLEIHQNHHPTWETLVRFDYQR